MKVILIGKAEPVLVETDDLDTLVVGADEQAVDLLKFGHFSPDLELMDLDHIWINVEALKAWAGGARNDCWEQELASKIEYAKKKKWTKENPLRVRSHIVRL